MRKLAAVIFVVLIQSVFFILSPTLPAAQRGIRVKATFGESLYLYKDYRGLVVGVSDYTKWPDLPNADNDAREVARSLKRLGFTTQLVSNPTSRELKEVLNDLAYRYGRVKNRAILFYYAEHGETEIVADGTKLGSIIPHDCPLLFDDPQGFISE